MRYSLRTLLLLMTVVPPVVGFWPDIKRSTIAKVRSITASDLAVAAAASTLIFTRLYVDYRASFYRASSTFTRFP